MILNAIIVKDSDGFFAYVPELEGCVSEGETYEEAVENIKEATKLYLETLNTEEKRKILKNIVSITPIEVDNA